jgi:uncharacterized protein YfaS (alpha-2-macroglobulin family)
VDSYDQGDLLRVTARFFDLEDEPVDPTTVTFKAKAPDGSVTERTYPADVTKEATGVFFTEWDLDAPGRWYLRVESTGEGQAAEETTVRVSESAFS